VDATGPELAAQGTTKALGNFPAGSFVPEPIERHAMTEQERPVFPEGELTAVEDERSFQEKVWNTERLAWVGFGLLVIAALSGLIGGGGWASHREGRYGGVRLNVPAIVRSNAPTELTGVFETTGERSLVVSRDFLEAFQIEAVQPTPESIRVEGENQIFRFPSDSGSALTARLFLKAQSPGIFRFKAGTPAETPQFTLVVLP
jgi:hypothetical protein